MFYNFSIAQLYLSLVLVTSHILSSQKTSARLIIVLLKLLGKYNFGDLKVCKFVFVLFTSFIAFAFCTLSSFDLRDMVNKSNCELWLKDISFAKNCKPRKKK